MKRFSSLVLLLAVFLLVATPGFAQFETAAVLGFVRDSSGAPVAGSSVKLINTATGVAVTTTTDNQGQYQFPDVHVGHYKIDATANGFSDSVTDPFAVDVGSRQRVDVTLKLGSVAETVTVSGAATQLESESSDTGTIISEREVRDLPLNGRAYGDLMALVPGVRRNNLENQSVTSRDASFNVNGQRSEFNNFLLDGLDNNAYGTSNQGFSNQAIPPSPDAINEFRVETNNYSAEFGRASGAVINVSINSGTNQLHGSVWEYHRNTVLNADGPFLPPVSAVTGKSQKPVLIRNQFGGALGGPILRDRLFYFIDYEGNRQVQGSYQTATIPTDLQRTGTFEDTLGNPVPLRNPVTGTVYSDGIIPQTDWTPLATLVINALPGQNVPGAVSNNYASLPVASLVDDKGDGRVDFFLSPKTTMFGRYSDHQGNIVDASSIPGEAGGGGNGTIHVYNRQIASGVTHTFGASSVLDARLGFTWTEGGKSPYLVGQQSLNVQAGIPGLPTDPTVVRALSSENVKSYTSWGAQGSNPQFQNPFVIDPKVNYSIQKGRHGIKVGWEFMSINTEVDDFNPVYGSENFSAGFSQCVVNSGGTYLDQCDGGAVVPVNPSDKAAAEAPYLADFLLGARNTYQLNNFRIVNYHQMMDFFYVQDDFRLSPKLTINAGLRYELVTPQYVDGNHLANFDPTTNSLIQASGGSLYDRALVHTPKLDFAPRLGLAYQLTPKTVIRSAYGISFDQFNREGGENLLAYNGPYIVNSSITQVSPFALPSAGTPQPLCTGDNYTGCFRTVAQGYPDNFADPSHFSTLLAQTRYIPKDISTGYVQAWHLDVQREIAKNTVLTASYVGEHGVHLWVLADQNQAVPNQTGQALSLQARRPITNFTGIEVSLPAGFLRYNALQAKLEHRFSQGFYLLNSFTWSRAIDNASGHLDTSNGDNSRVNLANLKGEIGESSYDQPLNDTLTVVWDLPFGRGRLLGGSAPRAVDMLLGDWQLTASNTATSGQPVNLTYSESAAFDVSDLLAYRPNVSGNPVNSSSARVKTATALTGFLNSANVSIPTDVTHPYGNAGRNSLRDMTYNELDLGLHKGFHLWSEKSLLDIRGEAFNLFNHVNYMAPDSNRSDGGFGSITSSFPPRQLQVAAKLSF
ncbi:MAG TPA: carboxypeptidase regulatory-like domain-containing protein [Terracidiphilus sp.]|nr:carboxypeptidase regulatory-like domain-containing protein [Terracidiphilus sp.]